MINKKKLWLLVAALVLVTNSFIFLFGNEKDAGIQIEYGMEADKALLLELFYSDSTEIKPDNMELFQMTEERAQVQFNVPFSSQYIRLDLGKEPANIVLNGLNVCFEDQKQDVLGSELGSYIVAMNDIVSIKEKEGKCYIVTNGDDPYVLLNLEQGEIKKQLNYAYNSKMMKKKIIICIVLDIVLVLMAVFAVRLFIIFSDIYYNRRLVFNLAKNDFRTKYAGSFFGMVWAFVQPIVTIVLYWFVFQVGLGSGDVNGKPFVLWLVAGLVPWMFFQDALMYGTNALMEYSFLVKKVVFNISILPVVKIMSACIVHGFFLLITVGLYTAMGYFPGIQLIQVLYYSLCTAALAIGLSYACSAIVLFFRDLSQIINIVLQVGTWMTPIMWQIDRIPEQLRWIFKLNPMYYVVQGYRDALLNNTWFFDRLSDTAYFWFVVIGLYAIGVLIFQKLKPHFADVL